MGNEVFTGCNIQPLSELGHVSFRITYIEREQPNCRIDLNEIDFL